MRLWSIHQTSPPSGRLTSFLDIIFFLFLIDAILSYWVPGFIQNIVKSSLLMGLVISFSSIVGLFLDVVFSETLIGSSVKRVIWLSVAGIGLFIISLCLSLFKPWLILLLAAMAVWGFYYDLFGFFSQQYVSETTPLESRPLVWAIVGFIKNLAYLIGPILVINLLLDNNLLVVAASATILIMTSLFLKLTQFKTKTANFQHKSISFLAEIGHWRVLFYRVWPLLIVSLMLGLIDATYWTTGTIVSTNLAKQSVWGVLFMPFYMLPSLLAGGLISKLKIKTSSNQIILSLLILAGGILSVIHLQQFLLWKLAIVFISSTFLAVSWPLINAAYTNLIVRMGREREHLIGLSDSMLNLAYIFGPILAGGIATLVGEVKTFAVMGVILVGVSIILWFTIPQHLRLPQKEIKTWS